MKYIYIYTVYIRLPIEQIILLYGQVNCNIAYVKVVINFSLYTKH